MVLRKFTRSGKKLNVHPLLTSFLLIVITTNNLHLQVFPRNLVILRSTEKFSDYSE